MSVFADTLRILATPHIG